MVKRNPSLLTTGQAAKLCEVTPDTILKWIGRGRLRGMRTAGGHYRVHRLDLEPHIPSGGLENPSAEMPTCFPRKLRCWEYLGDRGAVREDCRECVVYRVRAARCFLMAGLEPEIGHARRFCQGSCQDCVYYRRVTGLATGVLVIASDTEATERLAGEQNDSIVVRFARNAYEASAIIQDFRPAFAVVDEGLLGNGESGLLDSLAGDSRVPGLRIILAVPPRRSGRSKRGTKHDMIVSVLEKPFTLRQIAEVISHFPVDRLPRDDRTGKEKP
jgi:excisionase family DNA binding protein